MIQNESQYELQLFEFLWVKDFSSSRWNFCIWTWLEALKVLIHFPVDGNYGMDSIVLLILSLIMYMFLNLISMQEKFHLISSKSKDGTLWYRVFSLFIHGMALKFEFLIFINVLANDCYISCVYLCYVSFLTLVLLWSVAIKNRFNMQLYMFVYIYFDSCDYSMFSFTCIFFYKTF